MGHRYRGCRKAGCQGALRDRAQGPSATYRELGDSAQQYRNGFSGNQAPGTQNYKLFRTQISRVIRNQHLDQRNWGSWHPELYVGSKEVRRTEIGVLRRQILRIPGCQNLGNQDIGRRWELGEQRWSSEHPDIWDHKDPRKPIQIPGFFKEPAGQRSGVLSTQFCLQVISVFTGVTRSGGLRGLGLSLRTGGRTGEFWDSRI